MLCDKCLKNNATVHLNRVVNGNKKDLYYCKYCAKSMDETEYETVFSKDKALTSLIDSIQNSPLKVNYIVMTKCSKCGISYVKYKELGMAGCSKCYTTFEDKIKPIISSVQGNEYHIGKSPVIITKEVSIKREITLLKLELDKAIRIEAFEDAASIRDKIKDLESRMK